MKLVVIFAALIALSLGEIPALSDESLDAQGYFYDYELEVSEDPKITVHWIIWPDEVNDTKVIEFALVGPSDGWLALGFGLEPNTMGGGDFWIAGPGGVTYDAHRAAGDGSGKPALDDNQDVISSTEYISGSTATRRFRRLAVTGDETDHDIVEGEISSAWAFGGVKGEDEGEYSDIGVHSAKDHLLIDWYSADYSDTHPFGLTGAQILLFHGLGMFIAWAVLVPIAIYFAMFLKHIGHSWYTTHLTLQFAAWFIGLGAGSLMVLDHGFGDWPPHGYVGATASTILFIQPFIGLYANRVYDADRTETPTWPDKVHAHLGRAGWALALVNISFGLLLIGADTLLGGYIFWLLAMAAGFYIRYRNFDPSQEHAAAKDLDTAPYTSL